MNLENLTVGTTYKNWKALCETLEVEPKSGSYKQKQERDFKQFFNWEKQGQKITVTEIYDSPREREDGRKFNTFTRRGRIKGKFEPNEYCIKGEYTEIYITYKSETKTILIDTEDLDKVLLYRWNVNHNNYVSSHKKTDDKKETLILHKYIMDLENTHLRIKEDTLVVHHINRNPLDNRKQNLQIMTQREHIDLHKEIRKEVSKTREESDGMKEPYWIYEAKNGERYIQTNNKYLASGMFYLTDVPFYKITINDKIVYSFKYSDELKNTFDSCHKIKNKFIG